MLVRGRILGALEGVSSIWLVNDANVDEDGSDGALEDEVNEDLEVVREDLEDDSEAEGVEGIHMEVIPKGAEYSVMGLTPSRCL